VAACAVEEVSRIEARYSRYRPENWLAEINRAAIAGQSIEVDDETAALLDYSFACYQLSGGLFDITSGVLREEWDFASTRLPAAVDVTALLSRIGMDKLVWNKPRLGFRHSGLELDFGGIGKEYAADRAAAVCTAHGITQGLIDLGGDIRILGAHPDGQPWQIRIRHPRALGTAVAIVQLATGALATSGDYERYIEIDAKRYCHILNPHTGWPVTGLSSVSVVASECLLAGSLASIAMLKERHGIAWFDSMEAPYLWVDDSGRQGGTLPARWNSLA
jgi:thiamine biosynthesis lipoprotein